MTPAPSPAGSPRRKSAPKRRISNSRASTRKSAGRNPTGTSAGKTPTRGDRKAPGTKPRRAPAKRAASATSAKRPRPAVHALARSEIPAAVARLAGSKGTERFAAAKALLVTTGQDPAAVYPHFAAVAALLDGDNKILRWNALQILAALATVDTEQRVDALLDRYLAFITGASLITAANAIQGAGRIAQARPDLRECIVAKLLAVEHATYETTECRNVALGHVLNVLADLGTAVYGQPFVADFVRRQQGNPRATVARRAQAMLAKNC